MRLELLSEPIQILYCKMQAALSMRGFLEALRELLDELEWNEQTKVAFKFFLDKLKELKKNDQKNFEKSIKWVKSQLQEIKKGKWKNQSLKEVILKELSNSEEEIREGRAFVPNYFGAMITLLERIARTAAAYGEFDVLNGLGTIQKISVSFPVGVDPLGKPVEEEKNILPWTQEGEILEGCLKAGFISAKVLPPTKGYKINRYFIDQGMITIKWPDFIPKMLSWYLKDWRVMFDLSSAQSLDYLFRYAAWQDVVVEDLKLHEKPSDSDLEKHYNTIVMKDHLSELFQDLDQAKVRGEVTRILERFILVLLQFQGEGKGKRDNKDKAERWAYIRVKAILASKSELERKEYTNEQVIDMIMKKSQEEDLLISVTPTNCLEACRRFENQYGWPKKRGKARNPARKGLDNQ